MHWCIIFDNTVKDTFSTRYLLASNYCDEIPSQLNESINSSKQVGVNAHGEVH